jgi:CO/xanthine dehydrogenase FAD-binding subunit
VTVRLFLEPSDRKRAAQAAVADAKPLPDNGYKVAIARNLIEHALAALAALA